MTGAGGWPMSDRQAWTDSILQREQARKRSKYGATKVVVDGLSFDSKKEAGRWRELVLMQHAGQITDLRRQVEFPLKAQTDADMAGVTVGSYVADATYWRDGRLVVEDVKSAATRRIALYRLKAKIFEANYGYAILEV
jgi:hypothetical protein